MTKTQTQHTKKLKSLNRKEHIETYTHGHKQTHTNKCTNARTHTHTHTIGLCLSVHCTALQCSCVGDPLARVMTKKGLRGTRTWGSIRTGSGGGVGEV